jgi:hypothetical protein
MNKEKRTKQTLHFFIKTKKERIIGHSIAEILNDGEQYGAAQKGSCKKTFGASNWNTVSRMPRHLQTDTADEDRHRSDII